MYDSHACNPTGFGEKWGYSHEQQIVFKICNPNDIFNIFNNIWIRIW